MNGKDIIKWNNTIKKKKTIINKIDFVYTYVDSTDKKWLKKYKKTFPDENIDNIRYKNYGEIYFSLKTLEIFGKDICNKIYIVTDSQKLDINKLSKWANEKIVYIFHEQIIPLKFLPTFNSIVIESFLQLIPNLTSIYIYLNDDVFLGNTLTKNFLQKDDIFNILIYINNNKTKTKNNNKPWEHYYLNADNLFKERFGIKPNIVPTHTIHIQNKELSYITWIFFRKELLESMSSKRSTDSINFWYLSYLVGLYLGYFRYKIPNIKDSYVLYCKRIKNSGKKERMMKEVEILFKNKPVVFCYNNIIDVCKPVWNFIQEEYLKYKK